MNGRRAAGSTCYLPELLFKRGLLVVVSACQDTFQNQAAKGDFPAGPNASFVFAKVRLQHESAPPPANPATPAAATGRPSANSSWGDIRVSRNSAARAEKKENAARQGPVLYGTTLASHSDAAFQKACDAAFPDGTFSPDAAFLADAAFRGHILCRHILADTAFRRHILWRDISADSAVIRTPQSPLTPHSWVTPNATFPDIPPSWLTPHSLFLVVRPHSRLPPHFDCLGTVGLHTMYHLGSGPSSHFADPCGRLSRCMFLKRP